MGKKLKLVIGGIELLVAVGVSALVGGALAIVKPSKAGPIKKIGMGLAGFAIAGMASDAVTEYVDKQIDNTITTVKGFFTDKESKDEETLEGVEA